MTLKKLEAQWPVTHSAPWFTVPKITGAELYIRTALTGSVTLAGLASTAAAPQPLRLASIAFVGLACLPAWRIAGRGYQQPAGLLLAAFAVLAVVTLFRGLGDPFIPLSTQVVVLQAAVIVACVVLFCLALLSYRVTPADRRARILCVVCAPALFVAANLLAHQAGLFSPPQTVPVTGTSTLLEMVGISRERVILPLTIGLNAGGAMGALAVAVSVPLAIRRKRRRWLYVLLAVAGLATIASVDSRGALLAATLALLAVRFLPRASERLVAVLPLLLPLAPAIILWALGRLSGLSERFSRDPGDFLTGTGRQGVWDAITNKLASPYIEHLYGYGAYGQIRSDVIYDYAYVFDNATQRDTAGAHNIALQMILDSGYIGLAVFTATAVTVLLAAGRHARRSNDPLDYAIVAGLVTLVLTGATESMPWIYGVPMLVSFLGLSVAAVRLGFYPATWVPGPVPPAMPAHVRERVPA